MDEHKQHDAYQKSAFTAITVNICARTHTSARAHMGAGQSAEHAHITTNMLGCGYAKHTHTVNGANKHWRTRTHCSHTQLYNVTFWYTPCTGALDELILPQHSAHLYLLSNA